jgi:hypothetical protein
MPDVYDEASALFPALAKYRKLIVSVLVTAAPLVIFLASAAHSPAEILAACVGYVLANFGVYQVPNASSPAKATKPTVKITKKSGNFR